MLVITVYFEWMEKVIRFTMHTLGNKKIFFGFDGAHFLHFILKFHWIYGGFT